MLRFQQTCTAFAVLAMSACAQECDYYSSDNCLKADTSASVIIPFEPLFSPSPTFVWAIGDLNADDIQTLKEQDASTFPYNYDGPAQMVGWWLEFDNNTDIHFDRTLERDFTVFALETNSTNDIRGDHGGCEELLGTECVQNLQSLFAQAWVVSQLFNIKNTMDNLFEHPLRNLSCPGGMWGDETTGSIFGDGDGNRPLYLGDDRKVFASASNSSEIGPLPPGNASWTHSAAQVRLNSFDQQKSKAVIAISMSWPTMSWLADTDGIDSDEISFDMACIRPGSAEKDNENGSDGGGSNDDGEDAAAGRELAMSVLAFGVLVSFLLVSP